MRTLTTIAFDADDTLWHNERFFQDSQRRFAELLSAFADEGMVEAELISAERRNVGFYGFGVKGFTLSMLETATTLAGDDLPPSVIREILDLGKTMLEHPVELLPGVVDALRRLGDDYTLLVVTKGDLFDQERKLVQSGLADHFAHVEIVSDKTPDTYRRVFDRHGHGPQRAMMVGNSLKSDVLPALEAGSWAVHVPHELTWALEHAEEPVGHPRYRKAIALSALPALISEIIDE
ncbi:HAD family hydrolase [Oricola indica]|jgi:putative hydrolase of the HAD superfamily|uniref:HAD family hydrolase n=1 Tax=Oricola indica TaxID=2872591 RepID=UPI001CC0BA99|nr:HAD family hydrolase [Oricola indica]